MHPEMLQLSPICFGLLLCFTFSACLNSADDEEQDLQPPAIEAPSAATAVAPSHFLEVSADADFIPVAFSATDEGGLSEIIVEAHNGFDGHLHKSVNDFVLLTSRRTITQEDLTDPLRFETRADDEVGIYLDDRNPSVPNGGLVLAGPYHFSIKGADRGGNETSYADNSTYHSTFYLHRHYAPQVEVGAIDRSSGSVRGRVWRNDEDAASGNIVFLWVYIVTPNPENPAEEGDLREEWLWGKSNWPHQYRANTGDPLPSGDSIDLAELLTDQAAIRDMAPSDRLRFWAEDENGNISVYTFE